jgi:hypothetical protein
MAHFPPRIAPDNPYILSLLKTAARNPFKIGASRQARSEGTIRSCSGSEL